MFKRKKNLVQSVLLAVIFSLVGLMGGYLLFSPEDGVPLKPEAKELVDSGKTAAKNPLQFSQDGWTRTIEGRSVYTLCGHSEPLNLGSFRGMSLDYLLDNFPADQGWAIEDTGEKILITKKINALCPKDDGKRHLGHFGKYVAVIKGPVGIDGGILEVTDITLSSLPDDLRQQAQQGTLEFPDAQSLLEALDSMDEFEE